jgi:hypothetical protein
MTSLDVTTAAVRKPDFARLPWPLMGAGLLMCTLALTLTRVLQSEPELGRLLLLIGGLLCAGIALAIRLNTAGPAVLDRVVGASRAPLLLALASLFALMVLAATTIALLSFFDLPWLPFGTGTALILWFVVAPLGTATAYRVQRLNARGGAITAQEESAALLILSALCGLCAWGALYVPGEPESWDTMRMAVAVFSSVALIAAPLPLASVRVRRWTISMFVVLHFGGIAAASLSPAPSPWLVAQLWVRIYRPYLEFMYLNNAYHFYSPEPGAPSYLWCRLIYVDPNGNEWGEWYKVPDIDEKGQHHHKVALEYQRYLALTEHVLASDPTPAFFVSRPDGGQAPADFFRRRQINAPQKELIVGREQPRLPIPFHPFMATTLQFSLPSAATQKLLASFARHVAYTKAEPPAHLEGCSLRGMKIYRVRHEIPSVAPFAKNDPPEDPNDPELYRPFYMGQYNTDGDLTDGPGLNGQGGDPFLFWLLPVIRDDTTNPLSPITDYARLHAGDANYIYLPETKEWGKHR